jgi:hypothetical protein
MTNPTHAETYHSPTAEAPRRSKSGIIVGGLRLGVMSAAELESAGVRVVWLPIV